MTNEWENVKNFPPLWVAKEGEKVVGNLESVRASDFGNSYSVRLTEDAMLTLFDSVTKKPKDGPELVQTGKVVNMPSRAVLVGKLDQVKIGNLVSIRPSGTIKSKSAGKSDAVDYEVLTKTV